MASRKPAPKTSKTLRIASPVKTFSGTPIAKTVKMNFLLQHFNDYVKEISGRKGLRVLGAVGDGATDETIEDKTRLKMAEVRSLLNQLHQHGLVEYTREKNLTSGWFTYTWKFNLDRATRNFLTAKKNEYESLRGRLSGGENVMLYKCRSGCEPLPFDSAAENSFRCPKCNSRMKFFDNKKELKQLNQRIGVLEKILAARNGFAAP